MPIRKFRADLVPADPRDPGVELPDPPYDIEVGAGVGYHPVQYALANPQRTLVAIERTHERFKKFLGRIAGNGVGDNLIPIRSDALFWIVHHIPRNSVRRYFFLYPNPFPKHRRWYAMPFMEYVVETMMEGGELEMATNIEEYYREAKRYFTEIWGLELVGDREIDPSEQPRTHFEKKYLQRGERCWNLTLRKVSLNLDEDEVESRDRASAKNPAPAKLSRLEINQGELKITKNPKLPPLPKI